MSPRTKREYLATIYERYQDASRQQKTTILDEFCQNCGYHRKHGIRVLKQCKGFTKQQPKKRGKPSRYNKPELITALKRIWLAAHLPCSKRLKAIIPLWLPSYHQQFGILCPDTTRALLTISSATIDRMLKPTRIDHTLRGRTTTKPGTLLRKHIPIKTEQWDETRPGFLEADAVAHCGEFTVGMFVYTLDFVDIATGWTEQRAIWGKGQHGVLDQIKNIEHSLPFPLLGFDSDNGSEFLNHHLLRHFLNRKKPVHFTRSRPYHKDDNAHIEQKNWTHVRQWLGYDRLDNPALVPLMNEIYTSHWRLYHNFFCPSMKLISKKIVASKTIKRYDKPKTPYQRLLESPSIPRAVKRTLKQQFKSLNPFLLRKAIDKQLKQIFARL